LPHLHLSGYHAAMARDTTHRRVALAVANPGGFGGSIVRGAIDFLENVSHWRFVSFDGNPFGRFSEIDLTVVDGVIGFFQHEAHLNALADSGVPAVNVSNLFAEVPLPRVCCDDLAIGRMGAEYLLERGFSDFAFVGFDDAWFSQQRLAGFTETIDQAGRSCSVFQRSLAALSNDPPMIAPWLADLRMPVAVLAANDVMATGVVEVATALGLRVPDEVAVLGVDNDQWAMATAAVPISSVEPDGRRIGHVAAQFLDGLMDGGAAPRDQIIPPIGVVSRRSTDITLANDALVSDALRYIRDHYHEGIEVEDVLAALDVSRSTLERRMKSAIGRTPHHAISRARVERAQQMLASSDATVDQISRACGFRRQTRLNEAFKRQTGMTPGQYRRQHTR
jgi:LacI family transcriptional regulator